MVLIGASRFGRELGQGDFRSAPAGGFAEGEPWAPTNGRVMERLRRQGDVSPIPGASFLPTFLDAVGSWPGDGLRRRRHVVGARCLMGKWLCARIPYTRDRCRPWHEWGAAATLVARSRALGFPSLYNPCCPQVRAPARQPALTVGPTAMPRSGRRRSCRPSATASRSPSASVGSART